MYVCKFETNIHPKVQNCKSNMYIYTYKHMGGVLKVHVRVFNCQGRQAYNMRPCESVFSSESAKATFVLAKDLANDFNMRPRER